MSKNPPKPNTSPEHVKETAETYTCPSHIEARERLTKLTVNPFSGHIAKERKDGFLVLTPLAVEQILSALAADPTLLATPTQEGVGREEIDSLHAQLIEWADRDKALKHSLAQDNRFEAAMEAKGREEAFRQAAAAIEDRSLLPAPKPGEGAEQFAKNAKCSPGAPESASPAQAGLASDQAASSVDASRGGL